MGTRAKYLTQNAVIQKSLTRLRQMGLDVIIDVDNENEAFIFVDIDSVIRLIQRQLTYGNTEVFLRVPYIVVRCWREGVPK